MSRSMFDNSSKESLHVEERLFADRRQRDSYLYRKHNFLHGSEIFEIQGSIFCRYFEMSQLKLYYTFNV